MHYIIVFVKFVRGSPFRSTSTTVCLMRWSSDVTKSVSVTPSWRAAIWTEPCLVCQNNEHPAEQQPSCLVCWTWKFGREVWYRPESEPKSNLVHSVLKSDISWHQFSIEHKQVLRTDPNSGLTQKSGTKNLCRLGLYFSDGVRTLPTQLYAPRLLYATDVYGFLSWMVSYKLILLMLSIDRIGKQLVRR